MHGHYSMLPLRLLSKDISLTTFYNLVGPPLLLLLTTNSNAQSDSGN